jgi:hypothetical protein
MIVEPTSNLAQALARALYSGKELIVLDDVFKALDPSTERSILENLWGTQGLLRTGELTTVLASSDGTFSLIPGFVPSFPATDTSAEKHVAFAEHIVALDDKGHIKAAGSPEEVAAILGISISKADFESSQKSNEALAAPTESPLAQLAALLAPPAVDSEFTDPTRRLGAPGTFRQYGRSAGWSTVGLVLLSLSVYAFCGSFPSKTYTPDLLIAVADEFCSTAIWLGWWADEAAVHPNTPLGKWLGVYAALGVGSMAGAAVSAW